MVSARVSRNFGAVHAAGAVAVSARLPVAGKIRPGIKVLTAAASRVPGLPEKYAEGLAAGASFDEIAAAMKNVKGAPGYPLTPRNVPYFTARQGDFSTPGAAAEIMRLYAEVRQGDPEKRLYAFPVVFPSDDYELIFRENFEAYKASELLRWSETDPESGRLMCMRRDSTPVKNAGRRFGGRPTVTDRACDPNDCPLFAGGDCKHVASLNFWVPGVLGTGVIQMTFTSIYASLGISETLDVVRMGLGRVSGLHNGKPIFWLSKGREKVSSFDFATGKAEKKAQWIINLEASGLDMMQVLAGPAPQAALPAPAAPVLALEEPVPPVEPEPVATAQADSDRLAAAISEQRRHLSALFTTLGWDRETQGEWISDRHPDPQAATRDPDALAAMIGALEALASAPKPAPVEQVHSPEPAADDPEVPF